MRLHRDPLGTLQRAQAAFGDVFTLRLATARPLVVVCAAGEVEPLVHADPGAAHAGEGRRLVLPLASPRSVFGGDGAQHRAGRERIAAAFAPDAVAARRDAFAAVAERHVAAWPRRRPFRLLPHMRAVIDEAFVAVVLGVGEERRARLIAAAIRRMLWTPGNPPLTIPGEGDGLLGAVGTAVFRRRCAPLARLLAEEVDRRRADGPDGDDVMCLALRAAAPPSTDELVDELIPLLMAAQEPPAVGLTWLLDRLGRDPALAERYAAAPVGDPLRDAVMRETLRLRPPAVAALRKLLEPRTVAGRRIPAGVTVMLPIPLLHRDAQAFPAPDAFRPERWIEGAPPETTFLPFGGGARRCLGEHLARAYQDAVVPVVLRGIRLRPLGAEPERMVLRATTLVPQRSGLVRAER